MEVHFNVTKEARKALVKAISEVTGQEAIYLGAPSFAFAVGDIIVSRDGALTGKIAEGLLDTLAEQGYVYEQPASDGEPDRLMITVEMPFLSETGLENLRKLVAGKAALIKKALGSDDEPVVVPVADRLTFPWFRQGIEPEELAAWTSFISQLCLTAKKQKRVTLKEKPQADGDSEKFVFRCFLLKLGFIGDEYKTARKILLSRLEGNGSRKSVAG